LHFRGGENERKTSRPWQRRSDVDETLLEEGKIQGLIRNGVRTGRKLCRIWTGENMERRGKRGNSTKKRFTRKNRGVEMDHHCCDNSKE